MQQGLTETISRKLDLIGSLRTVFPALSRPRNRILAFLCSRPVVLKVNISVVPKRQCNNTKLRENVPEPIDDEHGFVYQTRGVRKEDRTIL